ncbi:SET domain-containing protein [Armillaria solidipes]|uniref:SET domain-containing protein n=1 Tax=Armillaria solidipes TaxID=1076256 RepID=A0A2H3BWI9_9AGAR|nr:SET domain-containing protein [Armillaria solidipes]
MAEVSTEDQSIDVGAQLFPESVADDFLPGSSRTSLRRSSRRTSPQISVASSESSSVGRFDSPHPSDTPEEQSRHLFLGGHRVCNWEDVRDEMRADPVYHLAENLPHALQDHINAMPLYTRMQPPMRLVFESMIRENTADDEPFAPPIVIENFVDDQPTPDWEFHYTNKMWHGDGVPPPDMKGLECCDCSGSCAKNKDCACRQRQLRNANGTGLKDWIYDPQGRVRDECLLDGAPIFECNDLCRCEDDCRNRVVQNGRKIPIKIAKTEKKGWGVFYSGTRRIPKGTFVGIYAGEIVTWEEAEMRGMTYDKWGRTYLFDLDFNHIEGIDDAHKYSVDAYHAGNFTRYLNHSCSPNCTLAACYINEANLHKPLLAIFTCTDVLAGEELTFSYCGAVTEKTIADTAKKVKAGKVSDVHTPCHCGAALCNGWLFAA